MDNIFEDFKGEFDSEIPAMGHELRFKDKLNTLNHENKSPKGSFGYVYKTFFAVAAAAVIGLAIFTGMPSRTQGMDLASVSTEFSETQDFFTVAIREELKKIQIGRAHV